MSLAQKVPNMTDTPSPDSSSITMYIITTLIAALGAVWGVIIMLIRYIENSFKTEISQMKTQICELEKGKQECEDSRHELDTRVQVLEAIHHVKPNQE